MEQGEVGTEQLAIVFGADFIRTRSFGRQLFAFEIGTSGRIGVERLGIIGINRPVGAQQIDSTDLRQQFEAFAVVAETVYPVAFAGNAAVVLSAQTGGQYPFVADISVVLHQNRGGFHALVLAAVFGVGLGAGGSDQAVADVLRVVDGEARDIFASVHIAEGQSVVLGLDGEAQFVGNVFVLVNQAVERELQVLPFVFGGARTVHAADNLAGSGVVRHDARLPVVVEVAAVTVHAFDGPIIVEFVFAADLQVVCVSLGDIERLV